MLDFAWSLPALREAVEQHLAGEGLGRDRVLACAVRLLDVGFFRIGAEMGRSGTTRPHYLGNTLTVARNSYIDPRVFDQYQSGWMISGGLQDIGEGEFGRPSIHVGVEDAVLDLLERRTDADTVERVAPWPPDA